MNFNIYLRERFLAISQRIVVSPSAASETGTLRTATNFRLIRLSFWLWFVFTSTNFHLDGDDDDDGNGRRWERPVLGQTDRQAISSTHTHMWFLYPLLSMRVCLWCINTRRCLFLVLFLVFGSNYGHTETTKTNIHVYLLITGMLTGSPWRKQQPSSWEAKTRKEKIENWKKKNESKSKSQKIWIHKFRNSTRSIALRWDWKSPQILYESAHTYTHLCGDVYMFV